MIFQIIDSVNDKKLHETYSVIEALTLAEKEFENKINEKYINRQTLRLTNYDLSL